MGASVLVLGGVAVATYEPGRGEPPHPAVWDSRVSPLVDFVEQERGLSFDHPVFVDFLSGADYTREATRSGPDSGDDAERLDRYAGELRALGVASGHIDLDAAFNQISDGGTLAFYSPSDQRIRVRGTTITVGLRVTLVHELTHALQDQRFDLAELQRTSEDESASIALRGLAEGDALRVENAYQAKELSTAERTSYDKEFADAVTTSEKATSDVPEFVSATFSAPYALGQPFAVLLFNLGGNLRVDEAFADPPSTEEHLFDPASYLEREGADEVAVRFGGTATLEDPLEDQGPFGATSWYLMLAERLDPKVAFDATLGWNGDDFAAVERDGRTCVRVVFVGDTERDEDEMAAALSSWAAAMPGGEADDVEQGGHPGLESCDPGESVDLELTGRTARSLALPSVWGYLQANGATVLDEGELRCFSRAVIDALSYDQISDPDSKAFEGPAFTAQLVAARTRCGTS